MKNISAFLLSVLLLTACTAHEKKILIYANSKIEVDESQKNIKVTTGTTQVERELSFSGSAPVILNVEGPQGKFTLEANEDGLYLANLKTDTIIGSMQHTGNERQTRVTQEQLAKQLDSLNKLVLGQNVSAESKNYFIAPGKIAKLSTFTNAKVFGPFSPVPSAFDASSVPEIYKFYKISEIRDIIAKLTEMSKYKYEKEKANSDVDDDSVYTIHPTKK